MASAFDDRLVTLTISVGDEQFTFDQQYYIIASGTRFTNGNFGDCAIRIDNISKQTRDYITTKTTTWLPNFTPADVSLSVGRESYGTFQLFNGNAVACNPSQPPDIGLIIKSLALSAALGYNNAFAAPPMATIESICTQVALQNNLTLDFQAKSNPQISNYHFTGSLPKQIEKINDLYVVHAYVDGPDLIVTDLRTPRAAPNIAVNSSTGMIGVPEVTELGCRVRMLINSEVKIGAPVTVTSTENPAVNGDYYIIKLSYEIASRETAFYWIMELQTIQTYLGAPQ